MRAAFLWFLGLSWLLILLIEWNCPLGQSSSPRVCAAFLQAIYSIWSLLVPAPRLFPARPGHRERWQTSDSRRPHPGRPCALQPGMGPARCRGGRRSGRVPARGRARGSGRASTRRGAGKRAGSLPRREGRGPGAAPHVARNRRAHFRNSPRAPGSGRQTRPGAYLPPSWLPRATRALTLSRPARPAATATRGARHLGGQCRRPERRPTAGGGGRPQGGRASQTAPLLPPGREPTLPRGPRGPAPPAHPPSLPPRPPPPPPRVASEAWAL